MAKTIQFAGRPVWAEISLKAILHNLRVIRKQVGAQRKILAVVKSNAYGLGAVPVAKALQKAGTEWFGVTCANEGVELREAGILQEYNLDVYLNGAKRIADGKFVRAGGEESGILNDDDENN